MHLKRSGARELGSRPTICTRTLRPPLECNIHASTPWRRTLTCSRCTREETSTTRMAQCLLKISTNTWTLRGGAASLKVTTIMGMGVITQPHRNSSSMPRDENRFHTERPTLTAHRPTSTTSTSTRTTIGMGTNSSSLKAPICGCAPPLTGAPLWSCPSPARSKTKSFLETI